MTHVTNAGRFMARDLLKALQTRIIDRCRDVEEDDRPEPEPNRPTGLRRGRGRASWPCSCHWQDHQTAIRERTDKLGGAPAGRKAMAEGEV